MMGEMIHNAALSLSAAFLGIILIVACIGLSIYVAEYSEDINAFSADGINMPLTFNYAFKGDETESFQLSFTSNNHSALLIEMILESEVVRVHDPKSKVLKWNRLKKGGTKEFDLLNALEKWLTADKDALVIERNQHVIKEEVGRPVVIKFIRILRSRHPDVLTAARTKS